MFLTQAYWPTGQYDLRVGLIESLIALAAFTLLTVIGLVITSYRWANVSLYCYFHLLDPIIIPYSGQRPIHNRKKPPLHPIPTIPLHNRRTRPD